jgi:hypothetical protein
LSLFQPLVERLRGGDLHPTHLALVRWLRGKRFRGDDQHRSCSFTSWFTAPRGDCSKLRLSGPLTSALPSASFPQVSLGIKAAQPSAKNHLLPFFYFYSTRFCSVLFYFTGPKGPFSVGSLARRGLSVSVWDHWPEGAFQCGITGPKGPFSVGSLARGGLSVWDHWPEGVFQCGITGPKGSFSL